MTMLEGEPEGDATCAEIRRLLQEVGAEGMLLLRLYDEIGPLIPPQAAVNRPVVHAPHRPAPLDHRIEMGRRGIIDEYLQHLGPDVRIVRDRRTGRYYGTRVFWVERPEN